VQDHRPVERGARWMVGQVLLHIQCWPGGGRRGDGLRQPAVVPTTAHRRGQCPTRGGRSCACGLHFMVQNPPDPDPRAGLTKAPARGAGAALPGGTACLVPGGERGSHGGRVTLTIPAAPLHRTGAIRAHGPGLAGDVPACPGKAPGAPQLPQYRWRTARSGETSAVNRNRRGRLEDGSQFLTAGAFAPR
jgi:hypothetical protein